MSLLFEQNCLAGIQLRNRSVRSATYEGLATEDGLVTPELVAAMEKLAAGEVGLIISGHAYVSLEGKASSRKLAIDRDECIPGLAHLARAVHAAGGRIVVQLAHAGAQALDGSIAVGPSPIKKAMGETICRALTVMEIEHLAGAFAAAALRSREAGFDGVQLHAAHGYLLSEFLSPYFNRRTDAYGGGIAGRSTLIVEILRLIKEKCGADYPVMIKINSEDFIKNGLTRKDCLAACAIFEKNGIDAIEFSGGAMESRKGCEPIRKGDLQPDDLPYYFEAAKAYKQQLKVPLILVGGIRYYETAAKLLADGNCDYAAFCRPLIREPELMKRWRSGDTSRAKCISCNLCMRPVMTGKGLFCVVEERLKKTERK
ncbi:MAG: NADH:flavin oxidoreductase [Victivallaceae bacterium]|nr:NADH:flavin oxidoreductase [Victivallaceae bacterium]